MPEIPHTETKPTVFAPLPLPQVRPELKRIRPPRRQPSAATAALLIPLFYAALPYLAGIVLTHFVYLRPGPLLAGLPLLAIVAVLAILYAPRMRWIPITALWLSLGAWSGEMEPEPAPNAALASLSDGLLRTVEGTVVAAEPLRDGGAEAVGEDTDSGAAGLSAEAENQTPQRIQMMQRVDLEVAAAEVVTDAKDQMQAIPKDGGSRVRVTIRWPAGSAPLEVACGQRIHLVIQLHTPEVFHDPGVWDRTSYLETQMVSATAALNPARRDGGKPRLETLSTTQEGWLDCALSRFRNEASRRLLTLPTMTKALPNALRASPSDTAMLTALLTGDRSWLSRGLRVGFERTGSFHLIVVSGLHLAILAGAVFTVARRLRMGRFVATIATLTMALVYALFTGFAVPVQRSFWMITLYLVGGLLYRHRSPLNVLGFAVLCLAAMSPNCILDASFQMTLLAVGAIAGVAAPLLEGTLHARVRSTRQLRLIALDAKLAPPIAQFRVTVRMLCEILADAVGARFAWKVFPAALRLSMRIGELIFTTLVVELALALPMAMYFHRITVYALPVNLFILPLLGLLVPLAMLLLVALMAWPAVVVLPAAACLALLHGSVFLIHHLGAFAGADFRLPEPGFLQVVLVVGLFVLALQMAQSRWRRSPHLVKGIALISMVLMAVATITPRRVEHPGNALLFEAIDVGQGDALLLISPEGKTLLVDGGGLGLPFHLSHAGSASSVAFDTGEEVVSSVLWSRGIRRLDVVALTHAHHDHMGGMPAILRNFRPHELWVGNNPPASAYLDLLREAGDLHVNVRTLHAGEDAALGSVRLRILAPAADYHPGPEPGNNDSLVMWASYGETSVLLAGDSEAPEEQGMLAKFDLRSTVLKVGHHGSLTSTRPEFLAGVSPAWAVISSGRNNRFGHPRGEILARLQAAHIRTYRTDLDGASCFLLDGLSVRADAMCGWAAASRQ